MKFLTANSICDLFLFFFGFFKKGCNGGFMSWAYESIIKMGGVEREKDYPYNGHGGQCKFNKSLSIVQIEKYVNLTKNEDDIARYVYQKGPVSIALNANLMQFYLKGIAHPNGFLKFLCSPNILNHGV
jgi:cathepsin F